MNEPETLIFVAALGGTVLTTGVSLWGLWSATTTRRAYQQLQDRVPAAARLEDLQPRLAELERRHEFHREAYAEAQARIAEANALREEIQASRTELVSVRAEREGQEVVRAQLAARQAELTEVEERLGRARTAESEMADRLRESERLERRLLELRKSTEEATRAEMVTQARLTQVVAEVATRERDLAARQSDLMRAREELDDLNREANDAQLAAARSRQEHSLAGQHLDQLRAETNTVRTTLNGLQTELEELKRSLLASRSAKTTAEAEQRGVMAELEARKRELTARQVDIARANEELAGSRRQADEAQLAAERALQERALAAQHLDQLRAETNSARTTINGLQTELEELKRTLVAYRTAKATAETERREAEGRLAQRQKDLDEANARLEAFRGQTLAIEERARVAAARQAEAEGRVRALEAERKAITDSIAALKAVQERLLEQVKKSGPDPEQAEAELWQPVLSRRPRGQRARSEDDALQGVRTHLENLGLVFPERTLNAFHTSLKVAEQSPLVVLAGISGTGKSELPRRYAEAMGMHFLPMAVQPRWDGPQDLFGFYNYLEHRYRPTELTRALLQMDGTPATPERGWRPPAGWAKEHSQADQMLLVLFDEMNLARVEYYFSDFLSKLETRRGVEKSDATARSKAEVVLEVGPREKSSSSMRLFADTNVLFVGTMNEDESTQTLSDKVVDRANVLRFGRPARLQRRDPSSSAIRVKVVPGLTHENFQSWVRGDDTLGPLGPQLDGTVSRLNEAMDRVGRPFAHRTHQAIRAYVANYPVQGEDGYRAAVGDQIEQRILPKLRGLDITDSAGGEALDVVRQVCVDIEDRALVDSIDQARSLHPHQFSWHGVDRGEAPGLPVG